MHQTAHRAYLAAAGGYGGYSRFWVHGARVTRVWVEPGHCPYKGRDSTNLYRADVQIYTFFGLPLARVNYTCGGWLPASGVPPVEALREQRE